MASAAGGSLFGPPAVIVMSGSSSVELAPEKTPQRQPVVTAESVEHRHLESAARAGSAASSEVRRAAIGRTACTSHSDQPRFADSIGRGCSFASATDPEKLRGLAETTAPPESSRRTSTWRRRRAPFGNGERFGEGYRGAARRPIE